MSSVLRYRPMPERTGMTPTGQYLTWSTIMPFDNDIGPYVTHAFLGDGGSRGLDHTICGLIRLKEVGQLVEPIENKDTLCPQCLALAEEEFSQLK